MTVIEKHGRKWLDEYLQDATFVHFSDIGWKKVVTREAKLVSSKHMEIAIMQALKEISAFQPKGATFEDLWSFFQAASK